MDEKNAYIELVKQNRAKHRAKLKASKEIKKLEQKKEKVILKYEQAAKDNTCITFHQYCRKKWASEAGIESVPDDDETDVEWQEKLNRCPQKSFRTILVLSMRGTQYHRPSWCEMTYPIMCRKAHCLSQQVVRSLNLLSRKLLRLCPLWKGQEN